MIDDLNRKLTPAGHISDELLSAYLDGEVTPEERTLVERMAAGSSDVAWRLDALRQTVVLVGQLPRVPLPRSFTLSEADIRPVPRAGYAAPAWWRALLNPVFLRNATAVATMLFLVVLIGNVMLSTLAPAAMAPAPTFATVVVQAPTELLDTLNRKAAPTAGEDRAAKPAPSPEPMAMSAEAPAAAESAVAAEATAAPEMVQSIAITLPSAAAPAAEIAGAGPAASEQDTVPTRQLVAATPTSEITTLAETAPAVEIAGAAADVPAQGAPPARVTEVSGWSWLTTAAVVLGSLALLLFIAWRVSLRSART